MAISFEDHHLVLLMEEAGEAQIEVALGRVIQRASKQLRFGADEIQPGQDRSNRDRLRFELLDLLSCIGFLERSGQIDPITPADVEAHMVAKRAKIDRMLALSRTQGRLEQPRMETCHECGGDRISRQSEAVVTAEGREGRK